MPDHQTILLALQKGEIDLIFGSDGDMLNLDAFAALQKEGTYKTEISDPVASRAILLNAHQPITRDINVRKAFQHAIDKKAIADGILNGSETIADTLMAKTVPYCDVDLPVRSYDVVKANELMEKAGWSMGKDGYRCKDGKKCAVTIYYNSNNSQERTISEYMQNDLKKIGVELKIVGEEKQAFLGSAAHRRIRPAILPVVGYTV